MKSLLVIVAGLAISSAARADLITGFEPPTYSGSPTGTLLTNGVGGGGQDGWFNPLAASADHNVHTYAGNSHGFVANPTGGAQFDVGVFSAVGNARAQHLNDFSTSNTWTLAYDINTIFSGGVATNNLSSFSTQDGVTTQSYIALNTFNSTTAPTGWNAGYNIYNAAGAAQATLTAGAAWNNLSFNHWYRQITKIDFTSHRVTEVSIIDIATGTVLATANPTDWYMQGGANSTLPKPGAVRLFGGGSASNITGWDNVSVIPAPSSLLALGLIAFARRRRA
jgi:hypothetical protein